VLLKCRFRLRLGTEKGFLIAQYWFRLRCGALKQDYEQNRLDKKRGRVRLNRLGLGGRTMGEAPYS